MIPLIFFFSFFVREARQCGLSAVHGEQRNRGREKAQRQAGREIKREQADKKTDRWRENNAQSEGGWDEGSAGDRSMSEGLLAEIERLPNQLCVGGPAVRLQGIPQQEHIKERS